MICNALVGISDFSLQNVLDRSNLHSIRCCGGMDCGSSSSVAVPQPSISTRFRLVNGFGLPSLPLEYSRFNLLLCETDFIELLFVGFISEWLLVVFDLPVNIESGGGVTLAVRRKCNVVENGFGLRVNMLDADWDLFTPIPGVMVGLSTHGTDLALSECERAFFLARI